MLQKFSLFFLILFALSFNNHADKKPNIILFLVDDMGWPDLSCYAQDDFHESPNIDNMANEGIKFEDAYAPCGVCSPSRASIMTGKYPTTLKITDWIPGGGSGNKNWITPKIRYELPLEETTIAEALKPAGYNTYHVGKWHLGEDPRYWPLAHGFDINIGGHSKGAPGSFYYPYAKIDPTTEWTNEELPKGAKPGRYLTDFLTDQAIKLIDRSHKEEKPFFLNMSYYTVHVPLEGRPDYVEKFRQKQKNGQYGKKNLHYAAMVKSLDDSVGRILTKLEELQIADETFIILTSDNGGLYGPAYHGNKPLKAGKGTHYEGGIREPFIIRYPGKAKGKSISKVPVHGIDIFPTILDVAGIKPKHNIDGLSLKPLFQEPKKELARHELFWHFPHFHHGGPVSVIRSGNYKLLQHLTSGEIELFDLSKDIGEKKNIAQENPEKASELLSALKNWKKKTNAAPLRPRNAENVKLYGRSGSPWKGANDLKNPVVINISSDKTVSLKTFSPAQIHYTLDGSQPTKKAPLYRKPFSVAQGAILKTKSYSPNTSSDVLTKIIPLPTNDWQIKASSQDKNFALENAFNDDQKDYWQASQLDKAPEIIIDFGSSKTISGFIYQPARRVRKGVIKRNSLNENRDGAATAYQLSTSRDGITWQAVQSGEFHYSKYAFLNAKTIALDNNIKTQFIKMAFKKPFGKKFPVNCQQLQIFGPAQ